MTLDVLSRQPAGTARAYGTQATLFSAMAHDMMLEPGWKDVAETMRTWLNGRGL